jgi:hypothetical protein
VNFKKHGLITTGLSSEVFLIAFLERKSGYEIARRLEKSTKLKNMPKHTPTNYPRVYDQLLLLQRGKFLEKDFEKKKYFPVVKTLVSEIEKLLLFKNIKLTKKETTLLKNILEMPDFLKELVRSTYKVMDAQPSGTHNINALEVICDKLGQFCTHLLISKQHNPKVMKMNYELSHIPKRMLMQFLEDYKTVEGDVLKELKDILKVTKKDNLNENNMSLDLVSNLTKSIPFFFTLMITSNITLLKFSNLWNQYEFFKQGFDFGLKILKKS